MLIPAIHGSVPSCSWILVHCIYEGAIYIRCNTEDSRRPPSHQRHHTPITSSSLHMPSASYRHPSITSSTSLSALDSLRCLRRTWLHHLRAEIKCVETLYWLWGWKVPVEKSRHYDSRLFQKSIAWCPLNRNYSVSFNNFCFYPQQFVLKIL